MLIRMEQAEHFIFLEYFIIYPGFMWGKILDILSRKAKEGVEVRVLYDGMNAVANLPHSYPAQLEKLGIHCKMFSPVSPFVSTHYNNRDHRKILVIDGHTAFTGGINLQDRYINREQVFGHWKDTAVMVQGEAARGFTLMFLQMWNADAREQIYEPYLKSCVPISASGYVIPYNEDPNRKERVAKAVYLSILNSAKNYVYIMTPYLILDAQMSDALQFAAKRGVDVRLILPHIPDKKYAFCLAQSHYRELLEAGVRIYEYTPGFIHAKVFLCDDRDAVVGTINLDYRSLYLHFECAAYLYKVPALADIKADFTATMERSQEKSLDDAKKLPLLTRVAGKLLKVVAPLM
jgi:cardiolipin synthase